MAMDVSRIQNGADVYGSDGDKVGSVSEVGPNYVLVTKGFLFTKDIYIPTSAITGVEADWVYTNVTKDQVEGMGWDQPPAPSYGSGTTDSHASTGQMTGATPGADYTATTTTGATGAIAGADRADLTDEDTIRVQRHEEELRAGTVEREAGRVRVTKDVEEEQRTVEVPVTREEVHVRSRQVDQPTGAVGADAFREGTIEVPIREEEAVVNKEVRVAEELEIEKRAVQDVERVTDTVRRERVDVEQVGDVEVDPGTDTGRGGTTRI